MEIRKQRPHSLSVAAFQELLVPFANAWYTVVRIIYSEFTPMQVSRMLGIRMP